MTHSISVVRRGNQGDHEYVVADVDITSLAAAGAESINVASELGFDSLFGGAVLGQENSGYAFGWDYVNEAITAKYPTAGHGHNVPADSSGTTQNSEFDASGNLAVGAGGSIESTGASTADDVPSGTDVGAVRMKFEGNPSA